jgi:hypothetical protein
MSRQISPSWRQDRDWLYVSFLAISDCKLLTYSKSDIHAFRKESMLSNLLTIHFNASKSTERIFPTVDAHNEGDRKLPRLVGNGVGKNKRG